MVDYEKGIDLSLFRSEAQIQRFHGGDVDSRLPVSFLMGMSGAVLGTVCYLRAHTISFEKRNARCPRGRGSRLQISEDVGEVLVGNYFFRVGRHLSRGMADVADQNANESGGGPMRGPVEAPCPSYPWHW